MSKYDLLDAKDTAAAARQGWFLAHVLDGEKVSVVILPRAFEGAVPHAPAAFSWVMKRAQELSCPTCIRALKLVTASRTTKKVKKK